MKFNAVEDIAAPASHVWARLTDFDRFEQRIGGRVNGLKRSPNGPVTEGTTWSGRATFSGKMRDVSVTLSQLAKQREMLLEGGTDGMNVTVDVELEAMGPNATRLTVTTEAKARTLAARLLLQSARLARQTLVKRYKGRVAAFAEEVERGVSV